MNEFPGVQGDVQVPPVRPEIAVLWTIDEARRLAEGSVVIWGDAGPSSARRAAVIHNDDLGVSIEHTNSIIYYETDLELIEYPALALTWPALGDSAPASPHGLEPTEKALLSFKEDVDG